MKRMIQYTAALALTVAVGACAGDRSPDADDNRVPGAVGTTGSVDADREFADEQLEMNAAEVELGRLAQQRATHADVKEFAAMMVRDHQASADALRPIAARVNTGREAGYESRDHNEHRETMDDLSELSGREFDRKYIEEMIDDHEKGVRELERRAENAADQDVKQWASRTLPKMREHLERARSIKETLDRSDEY